MLRKSLKVFAYVIAFLGITAGTYLTMQNQNIARKAAPLKENVANPVKVNSGDKNNNTPNPNIKFTPNPSPSPTVTNPPANFRLSDLNRDGFVNIIDIGILIDNYNLRVKN